MGWFEELPRIIMWGLAFWGVISVILEIFVYISLKKWFTIPLKIKLQGGKMDLHCRGPNYIPVYSPPNTMDLEIKDSKGKSRKFDITDTSIKMSNGIPITLSTDRIPRTFAADQLIEISQQMANAHIKNLNTFSVPMMEQYVGEDGKTYERVMVREIPLFDEESGNPIVDAEGKQVVRRIPMMRYNPIDPNLPDYEVPEFLSSKNLAERIEVESILATRTSGLKDTKNMIYLGAMLMLAGLGVAAIVVLVLYAPKQAAEVASTIATTTLPPNPMGGM